jgi:hypothetical protein
MMNVVITVMGIADREMIDSIPVMTTDIIFALRLAIRYPYIAAVKPPARMMSAGIFRLSFSDFRLLKNASGRNSTSIREMLICFHHISVGIGRMS